MDSGCSRLRRYLPFLFVLAPSFGHFQWRRQPRTACFRGPSLDTTNTSLLANTTSGNASVAISYSLSPLTQLGGTVTTNRASSSLQDAYTTTSLASLGRTLGRRWLYSSTVEWASPTHSTNLLRFANKATAGSRRQLGF